MMAAEHRDRDDPGGPARPPGGQVAAEQRRRGQRDRPGHRRDQRVGVAPERRLGRADRREVAGLGERRGLGGVRHDRVDELGLDLDVVRGRELGVRRHQQKLVGELAERHRLTAVRYRYHLVPGLALAGDRVITAPFFSSGRLPKGAPKVARRPNTTETPACPGSGVSRRWPGPSGQVLGRGALHDHHVGDADGGDGEHRHRVARCRGERRRGGRMARGSPARSARPPGQLALQPRVQRGLGPRLLHPGQEVQVADEPEDHQREQGQRDADGSQGAVGRPRLAAAVLATTARRVVLARLPGPPAVRVVVTGYRARLRRRYAATEGGAATATATPSAVITASRMPSAPLPGTVTTDR